MRSFNWISMGGAKKYTEADHRRATADYVDGAHILRIESVGEVARVRTWPELERAFRDYLTDNPFRAQLSQEAAAYLTALMGE